jgi:hypothetical protein
MAALAVWLATPRLRSDPPAGGLLFDGQKALAEARALVEKFGPRPAEAPQARKPDRLGANFPVAEYLSERFMALGYDYVAVFKAEYSDIDLWNLVVLHWGGAPPTRQNPATVTVVACHLDSVPGSPGAEDDASAVGASLELARVMKEHGAAGRLAFVIFDGEEIGGLGSKDFVEKYFSQPTGLLHIRACVAMEMLGWKEGRPVLHAIPRNFAADSETFVPAALPSLMIRASRRAGYSLRFGEPWIEIPYQAIVRSARIPTGSDDIWFLRRGIPALFLSTSSFFNFYSEYHQPSDTLEHLSAETLEKSGRIMEASLLELDAWPELPSKPVNYIAPFGMVIDNFYLPLVLPLLLLAPLAFHAAEGRARALCLAALAALVLAGAFSAWMFYPAALVTLRGLTIGWPLACFSSSRVVRRVFFWLGLLPFGVTFGVLALARISYGAGFRILVTPGEWIAVAVLLVAYAVPALALWRADGSRPA